MIHRSHSALAGQGQAGVSLIELMVALVIASLLGIGLVQIFGGTRAAFNSNSALARAQENSRFALDFLTEDLRHVGHLGTRNEQGDAPGAVENPVGNMLYNHLALAGGAGAPADAPWAFRLDVPIEVYEFTGTGIGATYNLPDPPVAATGNDNWTPQLPDALDDLADEALAGSDIIVMRYLSPEFVTLVNSRERADGMPVSPNLPFTSSTGTFFWRNIGPEGFAVDGGIYALSNASSVSLFQVSAFGGSATAPERSAVALGGLNGRDWEGARPISAIGEPENPGSYGSLIPLHRYHMVVYYVALGPSGEPSLFRRRLDTTSPTPSAPYLGPAEEMVPGVESLQVVMGVVNQAPRNSDHPLAYMTADTIRAGGWIAAGDTTYEGIAARMRGVVNARVAILMRSQLPSASQQEVLDVHDVAGTLITPSGTDRRLRHVYETQVAFRNRSRG